MICDTTRKLCGARLKVADYDRVRKRAIAQGKDPDVEVRKRLHSDGNCTRPALPDSDRCVWHGGYSTGPTTEAGKATLVAKCSPLARRYQSCRLAAAHGSQTGWLEQATRRDRS